MSALSVQLSKISQNAQDIMESIGWDENAFVPIASDENKMMMEAIKIMQEEKGRKSILQEQLDGRVIWLKQHVENNRGDIQRNLKLINAHRCQFETEFHMSKVASNEETSFEKQIKQLYQSFEDLRKKNDYTEDEIAKTHQKIDSTGSEITWIKTALKEWKEAITNGDEVNAIIDKYSNEDNKKSDALETKRRLLQTEITKQRYQLNEIYEEQKSTENAIERTAQLYRQTHQDRQDMVSIWRKAVGVLNARDAVISETAQDIETARKVTAIREDELVQQEEFLDQQIKNNRETEHSIVELNDRFVLLRSELTRNNDAVTSQSSELIVMKKTVRNMTNQLQQIRQKNRQILIDLEERLYLVDRLKNEENILQAKMDKFNDRNISAQDRLKSLNEFVESEEKSIQRIHKEMVNLSEILYRSQQILTDWHNKNKLVQNEIQLQETTIKAINQVCTQLQKEISHQTQIMYDVKYKLMDIESRVAKMRGLTTEINPETVARCHNLEKCLELAIKNHQIVRAQVTELEDNVRKIKTFFSQETVTYTTVKENLLEKQRYFDSTEKQLLSAKDQSQEYLVENSLFKMRLHQMEHVERRLTDVAFSLEKQKFELDLAINERLIAIQTEIDLLEMQKKLLLEERSQLRADISERKRYIDAVIARFELTNNLLGKNEDGSIISAIQLKVQMAQEKQMLLKHGSDLNEKVISAEKDINALENTLTLMNFSNDKYRRGLEQIIDEDEEQLKQINDLISKNVEANVTLKNMKANFGLKLGVMDELKSQMIDIEEDLRKIRHNRVESNDDLIKIHNEIFEQKSKMERAGRELKSVRKSMVQKIADKNYIRGFEKDLKIKEMEERNTSALQQLTDMVDSVMGLGPVVTKHLYEKGLQIPTNSASATQSAIYRPHSDISFRGSRRDSKCSINLEDVASGRSKSKLSCRSSSNASLQSDKILKTSERRPSILTLDFPGDESSRSLQSTEAKKNSRSGQSSKKYL